MPLSLSIRGEGDVKSLARDLLNDIIKCFRSDGDVKRRGRADGKSDTRVPQTGSEKGQFNLGVVKDSELVQARSDLGYTALSLVLAEGSRTNRNPQELKTVGREALHRCGEGEKSRWVGGPQLTLSEVDSETAAVRLFINDRPRAQQILRTTDYDTIIQVPQTQRGGAGCLETVAETAKTEGK